MQDQEKPPIPLDKQLEWDMNGVQRKQLASQFPRETAAFRNVGFSGLYQDFFKRRIDGQPMPIRNIPVNKFGMVMESVETRGKITEELSTQPRKVIIVTARHEARLQVEGSNLAFNPERLLAAWLVRSQVDNQIEISYPHLSAEGKIETKTIATFQPETMSSLVLKAMEAVALEYPIVRPMPENDKIGHGHFNWLRARYEQVFDLAHQIPLDKTSLQILQQLPFYALVDAAWNPDNPKVKAAFKQIYEVFSKPPFSILLNYLDATEYKYSRSK